MNIEKVIQKLEAAQNGETKQKVQIDFLYASITKIAKSDLEQEGYKMHFGKYNAHRRIPFLFYKPYSKLFNLNASENE